jgi:hypothetical protein
VITQNHFLKPESKKSMMNLCFLCFLFLMFNFSVGNKNLICHLLRCFVPFCNRKNRPTIDYHAFRTFIWNFNEKTTWYLRYFFLVKKSS